ncbi:TRAP transporter substrate-binding protein [Halomonas sp. SpR8]|uniref:TRAP transporter substrate-binding protein n=1 Tax=Halomonas sp. SpR8 TaxID=3050463 RepID=UPI0027E49F27|nr:TRAP transporter substrate-binding protein [Halomonas sp. SpR8]MDQ7729540.1 TRAP transporter substrate-binding protein [Halomonas sp. SpR8]
MKILTTALTALSVVTLSIASANADVRMRLANTLSNDHPSSVVLQQFADEVHEKTDGEVSIRLFVNAVLGSEREVLEQLQNGAVDITRVSAASLENFAPIFRVFSLPYIFKDEDDFYAKMRGPVASTVYEATEDDGFQGLTFFDSGARSFYNISKPIETPEDLQGLKLRVINSNTSIRMMELMGGTPTPIPYGEVYTALQSGVIDGAENNPTALTIGRHGEVAKYYSLDQHQRIPDFLVISNRAMEKLSDDQQNIVREAAAHATQAYRDLWGEAVRKALADAREMGVEINRPDQEPFRRAVQPLIDEYHQDDLIGPLLEQIISD